MSVNVGQTIRFKIKTPAASHHIDTSPRVLPKQRSEEDRLRASATLPQSQPACLTDSSTGLIDCGNWGVSASWTVPSTAVSGLYIAHLVRDDTGGDSQIPFVGAAAAIMAADRAQFVYLALVKHLSASLFCFHGRAVPFGGNWTAACLRSPSRA